MPRNRNVRVAVLGSSVQRAAASGFSSTRSSAVKRRIVVVGLVLVSLVLLTVSFRSTALDPVENFGATVLRPFEVGANRVARPFRDASSWTHGLFNAKAENDRLREANAKLRRDNAALTGARQENDQLHKLLNYARSASFPKDFDEVAAQVLTSPSALDQSVTISAGSDQGIRREDVVVTDQGLVGTVTKVLANESRVTLITDSSSAVRAVDQTNLAAVGIIDHGTGSNSLILDRVGKDKQVEFRRHDHDRRLADRRQVSVALPAQYPHRLGLERGPERHRHLQEHPGAAVRRPLVAPVGARPDPEAGGRRR